MLGRSFQLEHANHNPLTLRAALFSSSFAEGWAAYAEGMIADQGYRGGNPLFKLTVLTMRLRSIANTLLDIGIHIEGMTFEQAMTLMTEGVFRQGRDAAGKGSVRTPRRRSAWLVQRPYRTYADARRGEAALGGEFSLERYNDAMLARRTPPTNVLRELLFGLSFE